MAGHQSLSGAEPDVEEGRGEAGLTRSHRSSLKEGSRDNWHWLSTFDLTSGKILHLFYQGKPLVVSAKTCGAVGGWDGGGNVGAVEGVGDGALSDEPQR